MSSEVQLKPEDWHWCELCRCRSYSRDCECYGSTCNGGGCPECRPYFEAARQAVENNTAPSVDICKANSAASVDGKEEELLRKIFGK